MLSRFRLLPRFRLMSRLPLAAVVALPLLAGVSPIGPGPAVAQDYFVPGQPRGAAPPTTGRSVPRPTPPARPAQPAPQGQSQGQNQVQNQGQNPGQPPPVEEPPIQLPMPTVPELPALAKGAAPPAAVFGVIGVPEVMRASTSAQQVDRIIGERREKLNEDAQREQATWRELQQSLANQRNTMSPEQIRGKERELQERITSAQRQFRDRNRIIQEAAQVGLNQIQATLIAVIRQVAESRNMNLVLHRAQVALNVNEFDITEQVAAQINRLLPAVTLPADGVSAAGLAPVPVPILTAAPAATPAAASPAAATPAAAAPAAATPAAVPPAAKTPAVPAK